MTNELQHHGILGQKWGVRRFQNKDGSLTAAGRKRQAKEYEKELNKLDESFSRKLAKHHKLQEDYLDNEEGLQVAKESFKYVKKGSDEYKAYSPMIRYMTADSKILKKKLSESSKELEKDQNRIKEIEDLIRKSSEYGFKTKETERTFKDGNRTNFVPGNKYKVTSSKIKRRFGGYNNKRALTPTRG